MKTWTVDTSGAGDFETIGKALDAAAAGDEIVVRAGIYREEVRIGKADITLRAAAGEQPVIDVGYSFEAARLAGDSWKTLKYTAPKAKGGDGISVAADGVTIDGLTVRNTHSSGIDAGAVDGLTVRNCRIRHTYGAAIKINGTGGTATNILIENNDCNIASVMLFDDSRVYTDPQGVSGVIKVGNADGVIIRGNVVARGFGEGINLGKNLRRALCVGNVVYDCQHTHIYVNSGVDIEVRDNIVFCTGDLAHLWHDADAPAGLKCNDETTRLPYSANVRWTGNVVVNVGVPWELNSHAAGAGLFYFASNTLVWGPLTRRDLTIRGPHGGLVENNIFHVTGGAPSSAQPEKMVWRRNLWRANPPPAQRGAGDVVAETGLARPAAMPTAEQHPFGMGEGYSFNLDNYRPVAGSPALSLAGDGRAAGGITPPQPPPVFAGALAGLVVEPPDEPDPPVEPEPDWAGLAARVEAAVVALGRARQQTEAADLALHDVRSQAAVAESELEALRAMLADEMEKGETR